jgi:hypothetical protein
MVALHRWPPLASKTSAEVSTKQIVYNKIAFESWVELSACNAVDGSGVARLTASI